jgi:methionyl-tRNA formyltransferase
MNVRGVLGLAASHSVGVSGYCRLDDVAASSDIPYWDFTNINDANVLRVVQSLSPDLLFVVGLSQLVKSDLLAVPVIGCIGFHPTWLPEGRGRAALAWLTLNSRSGAATFFLMKDGADDGPILAQQPFSVTNEDYASDVLRKIEAAIDVALDQWLPALKTGKWEPIAQDDSLTTYNGVRKPEDGLIDWYSSAEDIHALIRATSRPHPGAYTYLHNGKLIVWRAKLETRLRIQGVIGRVLLVDQSKGALVQTGHGLLWLTETELAGAAECSRFPLRVGVRLGYSPEDEIFVLKSRVDRLEEQVARLLASLGGSNCKR